MEYTVTVTAVNGVDAGDAKPVSGMVTVGLSTGTLKSSTSTSNAGVKLTLTIELEQNLTASDWVEIYLENDYQEPGSIATANVLFEVRDTRAESAIPANEVDLDTSFPAAAVEVDDGGKIDGEGDAVVISARIPDMKDGDETGYPKMGQKLIMVVSKAAGIKNPSEEGSHSVGFAIIGGTEDRAHKADMKQDDLLTKAKIALSADDGGRGKEVTITGTGFNNGVSAEAFVLSKVEIAKWWESLTCAGMKEAMGSDSNGFCFHFDKKTGDLSDTAMHHADFTALDDDMEKSYVDMVRCRGAINAGKSLGTANVGSDDEFSMAFTVHQDEFDAGNVNYICAEDSEAGNPRAASAVKMFDLTASISLDPAEANSGDEVTLKARDFGGALDEINLGPDKTWTMVTTDTDAFPIKKITNNSMDYTFEVPGGLSGKIQVDAKLGKTRKTADLTVTPSSLELSKTEVAPNESIVISGRGFSDDANIKIGMITIDGKELVVDEAGIEVEDGEKVVRTTSSGQFTATVNVWHLGMGNPALDAGEYTIKVTDGNGYEGETKITVLAPTVMVTPLVAGPRDFITISGANWPVTTSELDNDVTIKVDEKTRSASIDSTGRFNYSYQLSGGINIGAEHEIVVKFTTDSNIGSIEEKITFSVPSSNVVITPAAAAPGETIELVISGMPIYERVTEVTIDGGNRLSGTVLNTDSQGDVTITGIVIPFADPGFYPVKIVVGTGGSAETTIVQLEILDEGAVRGAATALPGALSEVGDNLVRVFHFNNANKSWTFYDPRPEFEGLNTLTELADGQPYGILVSESQENVVLNGRPRDLTCVGGDCWNQVVW